MLPILFEIKNSIAFLTLNRPEKFNAFNREMALMLQVERTYSASSKIISTVDEMLQSLLAAVGN